MLVLSRCEAHFARIKKNGLLIHTDAVELGAEQSEADCLKLD
jgi:hypothetical protein